MHVTLTTDEREQLTAAAARERRVRHWRRYQALLRVAEDTPPEAVAAAVGCSRASVYNWVNAWQAEGIAGLVESSPATPPRPHALPLAALLTTLLGSDPQQDGHHATGWTVALLHGEAQRAAARLALEATEVCAGMPRSRIRGKKGALSALAATVLAAGGSVWCGDETTLREFPPLRAAWAQRGEQQVVVISGRNARRVLHGAPNIGTGEVVRVARARSRGADSAALIEALAARCATDVPHLLIWDNAPPHHTHAARDVAMAAGITIGWLPFRSPELNPCEDIWRGMKGVVAANRVYTDVDELMTRAIDWLDDHTPDALMSITGLRSSKFDWLPT